jgi:toxin ParE1/3/4
VTHTLHVRKLAQADLVAVWLYGFEKWGEDRADRYLDALDRKIRQLASTPELGHAIDPIKPGYRLLRAENHAVIYRIEANTIHIIRVLGEAMNITRHL